MTEYHDFRLQEVQIVKDCVSFAVKWQEKHGFDEYQADYTEKKAMESTFANNAEMQKMVYGLAKFTGSMEDNVRVTKIKVCDFGDEFETVQFFYETDLETGNPNQVKTSKLDVSRDFGDECDNLKKALEAIKVNAWEFCCQNKKFRPHKTEAKIVNGEIML